MVPSNLMAAAMAVGQSLGEVEQKCELLQEMAATTQDKLFYS